MGVQNSCKTLNGLHLTMHLLHSNNIINGLATIYYGTLYFDLAYSCADVHCDH